MKDETLTFVREKVSARNPDCKVIVAPTLVGVYLNKSKDALMRTALCHHWKFQYRGILTLVYHPLLNRLKLIAADENNGRTLWQETFGDYTNYESIHALFHILNSSTNFCHKIGLFYADVKVARMVCNTLGAFATQKCKEQPKSERSGKLVCRSKSFDSSERSQIEFKLQRSYSNSVGDIKINRTALNLLEAEAGKYASKQSTRRHGLRKMFSGLRSSFRVRIRRQDNSEAESMENKRKRLSNNSSNDDSKLPSPSQESEIAFVQSNGTAQEDSPGDTSGQGLEHLSANWKLTDRELQELYRLSFFKERNQSSTDLCATEL